LFAKASPPSARVNNPEAIPYSENDAVSEHPEVFSELDDRSSISDEAMLPVEGEDDKPSDIWLLVALGSLALLLIWIILGIWRYLQVLGYGSA
jgi:hypothetical protein